MMELIPGLAEMIIKYGVAPVFFAYLVYNQFEMKKKLAKTEAKLEKYITEDRQKGHEALTQSNRVIEQNNKILESLIIMK